MLLLSRGGGNDLLDYMPTDACWRAKGVAAITVERMAAELTTTRYVETAQAMAVRRLMCLRALGELRKAEALPPFARAWTRRISSSPTTPARPSPPSKASHTNARAPPKRTFGRTSASSPRAAASSPRPGRPPAGRSRSRSCSRTPCPWLPPGQDPGAALNEWTKLLLTVAERVGNVRLDAVTVGVAEKLGDRSGFLVAVGRGLYDPEALKAVLRQAGATAVQIDGLDVLTLQTRLAFLPCSNDRLVLAVGPTEEEIPAKELVAAIRRGGTSRPWPPRCSRTSRPSTVPDPRGARSG